MVPVCVLTPIVFCGGFVTLIISFVFGVMKSTEPYQVALETVQANQTVQAALGTPIEPGFWVMGNFEINNQSGYADLSIPVSGPSGEGRIFVVAGKSAGIWTYDTLVIDLDPTGERLDLLSEP